MNSPNLQQRIYLAKALNENTDTLFDHPQMNEEEMGEESISEGVRRMRRLRRAHVSGKASRKTADAYDKELSKLSASRLRRGGARKQTIRGFFTDKPTTPAADKAYERFTKGAIDKAHAKGKKIFEGMDLDEGSYVHSKGQLKKSIKGSKREIVKAMKRGNKKEASFWMQNKKDAEEQLKEGSFNTNNQFLQHLNSITPQGRAKDTKIFIPAEELQEGSRGTARHERRIKSLERKRKQLYGYLDRPRGIRISAEQEKEAQKRSADPAYQAKKAKYNKLAKDLPSADIAQIARERRRAGLSPKPPTRSLKATIDRTGSSRITSQPTFKPDSDSGYVAPRVPKKVLKYRETSKFKGQVGRAAKKMNEEVKKKSAKKVVRKLKKTGRSIKRAIKGLSNILSTPQDNVDYMMTGRKF